MQKDRTLDLIKEKTTVTGLGRKQWIKTLVEIRKLPVKQ